MNIQELLATLETANVAVKRVPELEVELNQIKFALDGANSQISVQSETIQNQSDIIAERNAAIEWLEEELSEARFREQAARENADKIAGAIRDMLEFGNSVLPSPVEPEPVKPAEPEVTVEEIVPLENGNGEQSGGVPSSFENPPSPEASTQATDGQSDKPYLGKPWSEAPDWMTPQEWVTKGGLAPWWYATES